MGAVGEEVKGFRGNMAAGLQEASILPFSLCFGLFLWLEVFSLVFPAAAVTSGTWQTFEVCVGNRECVCVTHPSVCSLCLDST